MSHGGVDLQDFTINEHWQKFPDVLGILSNMEKHEPWTLDADHQVKSALVEWAIGLDESHILALREQPGAMLDILFAMGSQRSMYLLHAVQLVDPQIPIELMKHASQIIAQPDEQSAQRDNRAARAYRDRVFQLFMSDTITTIFSRQRLDVIKQCIADTNERFGEVYET